MAEGCAEAGPRRFPSRSTTFEAAIWSVQRGSGAPGAGQPRPRHRVEPPAHATGPRHRPTPLEPRLRTARRRGGALAPAAHRALLGRPDDVVADGLEHH